MPKKKVRVKTHKRRKPGGVRKTVTVRGYARSPPQGAKRVKIRYPKRKTRRRRKK